MFSRKKEQPKTLPVKVPTKSVSTLSIISPDVTITGDLVSLGDVQIEGAINGNLRARGIVVGGEANIHGEIAAEEIVVRGYVKGEIRGDNVTLAPGCLVIGNIYHKLLTIETGADFDGRCTRSEEPLAKAAADRPETPGSTDVANNAALPKAAPPRAVNARDAAARSAPFTEADLRDKATVVGLLSDEIDELEDELNAARAAKFEEETAGPKTKRRVIGTHLAPRPAYAKSSAG